MKNKAYLSFGSNRGDRKKHLENAIELPGKNAGDIIQKSSLYETQPWKMEDETYFINQVILLETKLSPEELMETILGVEKSLGRMRTKSGYEPRTIDIDILFYNTERINTETFTIPHPLLQERRFILIPMVEIAPDYIHPVFKKSMAELLKECRDNTEVKKLLNK